MNLMLINVSARLADFMAADLSALDVLVVQIDGLHPGDDLVLVAATGVRAASNRPLPKP